MYIYQWITCFLHTYTEYKYVVNGTGTCLHVFGQFLHASVFESRSFLWVSMSLLPGLLKATCLEIQWVALDWCAHFPWSRTRKAHAHKWR